MSASVLQSSWVGSTSTPSGLGADAGVVDSINAYPTYELLPKALNTADTEIATLNIPDTFTVGQTILINVTTLFNSENSTASPGNDDYITVTVFDNVTTLTNNRYFPLLLDGNPIKSLPGGNIYFSYTVPTVSAGIIVYAKKQNASQVVTVAGAGITVLGLLSTP